MPNYIGKKEDEAIKKFIDPKTTSREKSTLYNDIIYVAFKKLVDNLIYKYNQKSEDPNNDLRDECISHLTTKMDKYDPSRGPSFKLFNMIAKNYILQHIGRKKKFSPLTTVYRKDVNDMADGTDENTIMKSAIMTDQFVDSSYVNFGESNQPEFSLCIQKKLAKVLASSTDRKEQMFINAIILIIDQNMDLQITNKKLLYSSIRELTNMESRDITKYLNILKPIYKEEKRKYEET